MRAYIITPGYTGKRRYHGSPILRREDVAEQVPESECISWIDESLINPKFRERKEVERPVDETISAATGPEIREKLNEVFNEVAITKPDTPEVKPEFTRENLEAAIKAGKTTTQLTEMFGIGKTNLYDAKHEWGLTGESKHAARKHDLTEPKLQEMIAQRMSYSQIAQIYGLHQSTVGYYVNKWGLTPARSANTTGTQQTGESQVTPKDPEFDGTGDYVELPPMPSREDTLVKDMQALVAGYTAELTQIIEQQKEMAKRAEVLRKKRDALDATLAVFEPPTSSVAQQAVQLCR